MYMSLSSEWLFPFFLRMRPRKMEMASFLDRSIEIYILAKSKRHSEATRCKPDGMEDFDLSSFPLFYYHWFVGA